MKRINSEKIFKDILQVIKRFPLTMIFIVLLTIWQLLGQRSFFIFEPIDLVFSLGILFSMVGQLFYERFFKDNQKMWWLLKGTIGGFLILYYLYLTYSSSAIDGGWTFYSIPGIRTMGLFFVGTILFIWAPTIKQTLKFSESFLATFKNYFSTIFFSVILFLGVIATFALFEFLFFQIDFNWSSYTSTLVFHLFAPIFFLTNVPKYHLKNESTKQATEMPKFLMYLVSYILVPIMALLTGIIVLYIVTNLTNDFFADNILEGLLLGYTINGWILLLLTDGIDNKLAKWFRKIFPYSLIFVVILQMISTYLEMQKVGITHGRYFILLFGIGSVISAVWYLMKQEDLKVLPIVAVAAGLVAIIPPIDAMSLSVRNQRSRIASVLFEQGVLNETGDIDSNADVPVEDQATVIESLNYLSDISALNQLDWLPENQYYQRSEYLGFEEASSDGREVTVPTTDIYLEEDPTSLSVAEFDHFLNLSFHDSNTEYTETIEGEDGPIEVEVHVDEEIIVTVTENNDTHEYDFTNVLEEYEDTVPTSLSLEEMTFTEDDAQIIVQSLYRNNETFQMEFYLLF